ncbi:MAG: histidine kinase [Acidobacteria bacterium]|nr:histidine kinase [Acidobacteriota bacterium]MCB9396547.1 histidine kinase [Acidobacteriota bacterium]
MHNSPFAHSLYEPLIHSPYRRVAWMMGGCLGYGLYRGLVILLFYFSNEQAWYWWESLVPELLHWLVWSGLLFVCIGMARRFPLVGADKRWPYYLIHGLVMLLLGHVHVAVWKAMEFFLRDLENPLHTFWAILTHPNHPLNLTGIVNNLYKYPLFIGGFYGLHYLRGYQRAQRKAQELALKSAQLEQQVSEARLHALRMQLNPHFLFNTLNSISVLTDEDPAAARKVLLGLSQLLRVTLDQNQAVWVPLDQEFAFLQRYLEIEKVRFPKMTWTLEQALPDFQVPFLILQPLVENAIKHGLSQKVAANQIRIRAFEDSHFIRLSVWDNGGESEFDRVKTAEGYGLALTRKRLEHHYGSRAALVLRLEPDSACAEIEIAKEGVSGVENADR